MATQMMTEAKGQLPDDFPAREQLRAAGVNTYSQVRKADLTSIDGIGDVTAGKIQTALAEADAAAGGDGEDGAHGASASTETQTRDAGISTAEYQKGALDDVAKAQQDLADARSKLAEAEANARTVAPHDDEYDDVTKARRAVETAIAKLNAAENRASVRSTWTADQHRAAE